MSLDTNKIVKKITYRGIEFVQAGSSNLANDLISGTITEVNPDTLGGVESIRNNAFSGMEIETVSVPSNIATIGDSAFSNNNITTLTIDEGVTSIGNNAFQNNSIQTVTIPSTVTSIGDEAFAGNNLTEITMQSDDPPIVTSTTFPSTLQTTNVSYKGYSNYSTDPNWQTYKNTLSRGLAIPSTITVTVNDYLGELVSGASVTISGNGQTYTGTTNENGVYTQGDLQPATYTISLGSLDGYKSPEPTEVVVEEDTQNSVTVTYLEKSSNDIDPVFGNNSPEVISAVASEIATKGYTSAEVEATYGWKIGDTTSYTLSTGETVTMRIVGFNHDDLSSGKGKAGITLDMTHCLATMYPMSNSISSKGGYPDSVLRKTTLPAIKATMPQEWQDIIVNVNKTSVNGGGASYTGLVTTSESLFICSIDEFLSSNSADGDYFMEFGNEGTQYEYWQIHSTNSARVKMYDNDGDGVPNQKTAWWVRSASKHTDANSNAIASGAFSTSVWNNESLGVSYAFCIGTPKRFADYTPSEISQISAEISSKNMTSSEVKSTYGWNIGDTTSYQLTTGENVEMRIIGFNHDDKSDGSGKAGITLEMTHSLATKYFMNKDQYGNATTSGGYPSSVLRTTSLPAIKATIPQEWRDVIVNVNKKSANGGGSYYTETVTTSDDLFLLSEMEIRGSETLSSGRNEGSIYEYWNGKTDSDRIKQYDSDGDGILDKDSGWWIRSCRSSSTTNWAYISSSGGYTNLGSQQLNGVSYAFCI